MLVVKVSNAPGYNLVRKVVGRKPVTVLMFGSGSRILTTRTLPTAVSGSASRNSSCKYG